MRLHQLIPSGHQDIVCLFYFLKAPFSQIPELFTQVKHFIRVVFICQALVSRFYFFPGRPPFHTKDRMWIRGRAFFTVHRFAVRELFARFIVERLPIFMVICPVFVKFLLVGVIQFPENKPHQNVVKPSPADYKVGEDIQRPQEIYQGYDYE